MNKTLGEIAYNAYCKSRNWLSFKGDPLPHFDQQDEGLKIAWEEAGKAVAESIAIQTARG